MSESGVLSFVMMEVEEEEEEEVKREISQAILQQDLPPQLSSLGSRCTQT